jgi:hypothetical protein
VRIQRASPREEQRSFSLRVALHEPFVEAPDFEARRITVCKRVIFGSLTVALLTVLFPQAADQTATYHRQARALQSLA